MDNEKVPEWASERAVELYNEELIPVGASSNAAIWKHAFARYIAEREEPPVDPLLVEAREIAATQRPDFGGDFRSGALDGTSTEIPVALVALRRGMELAARNPTRED